MEFPKGPESRPDAPIQQASFNGPVALIGGWVHSLPCLPVDRRLVELTGKERPLVTIVAFASSARRRHRAEETGRRFWHELGAEVRIAAPDDPESPGPSDALEGTDIVVLTGGDPRRLRTHLRGSPTWHTIRRLWSEGAAVSGSSAGCMELCEWTLSLELPNPLGLTSGLGLLANCVSLPHFNRYGISFWSRCLALGDRTLIGIDERTGLVGKGGTWEVIGAGGVTVIQGQSNTRYSSGCRFELDLEYRGSGRAGVVPSSSTAVDGQDLIQVNEGAIV